jgi:hypothetical protein
MRFVEILAASLVVPLVVAHSGVPGVPKIFGLPPKDIAALKARSIFGRHAAHRAAHVSHLKARQGGQDGRCGKQFGCATCAEGYCCSPGGYCELREVQVQGYALTIYRWPGRRLLHGTRQSL